jgi:hypothetical protein
VQTPLDIFDSAARNKRMTGVQTKNVRGSFIALSAMLLVGCGAAPPKMLWLSTDGQRVTENTTLKNQFDSDGATCLDDRRKAADSGTFISGGLANIAAIADRSRETDSDQQACMAQRGYLMVAEDQASAKQAELAAAAAEKKRQQEAAEIEAAKPAPKKRSPSKTKPAT